MSKLRDRLTPANQSHNFSFSLLDDSAHICDHIDQSFAHGSVHDSREISRCENASFLNDLNFSNQTGQFGQQKQNYLCCRTFFTEKQIIQQPQSTKYEFKGFKFPLKSDKNQRIKKTICSFLNCKGGFIFIGIVENVTTKQHKVVGDTYNQAQKQEILKQMRKNAECIEPQIIMSKKMEISFVPVKFSFYPYSFIPGRFVIKIKIYPGSKEEVYTVCCDDQVLVCMRTENQVLSYDPKKNFRKMLQIQKERVKSIHDLSQSFYKHKCKRPENGIRIFSRQNRITSKQNRYTSVSKQKRLRKRRSRNKERSTSSSATCEQTNEIQIMKKHKLDVADKNQNTKYKNNSSDELSYISSSSSEQEKKKKEIKSKKQRKMQKRNEKDKQKVQEIMMKQSKQLRNNKVNKKNEQSVKVSCERIVERFYTAKKQQKNMKQNHCLQAQIMQAQIMQKVYQKRSVKSVQKIKGYDRKSESKSEKEVKEKVSPKSQSSRSSSKKRKEMQQKYLALEKHLNRSVNYSEGSLESLINEMIAINHTSHKIFGFAGFSKNRIEIIKQQLARINENDSYQFSNLLVYKFSKNSNEISLKQAISKSIKTNRTNLPAISLPPITQPIPYPNTTRKQRKPPRLDISFEYEQQSICDQSQKHKQKSKQKQKQSKEYRIVFKLTHRIKVLMYHTLSNETKQKIKETIKLVERLSMKKNIYDNNYWDDSYVEVHKVKELYLPNMYYSLLVYLELVNFDIQMLFF